MRWGFRMEMLLILGCDDCCTTIKILKKNLQKVVFSGPDFAMQGDTQEVGLNRGWTSCSKAPPHRKSPALEGGWGMHNPLLGAVHSSLTPSPYSSQKESWRLNRLDPVCLLMSTPCRDQLGNK